MFKKIFYSIVIAAILFLIAGFFLPQQVHVERSIDIERPASTVFTVLNSYRSFAAWSPWAERDPDAVYELSGPDSGPGARLNWRGDPRLVGTGWQEIIESRPYSLVRMRLDFDQQGAAQSYFQIGQSAAGSRLTWGFDTDLVEGHGWFGGLLARYFGLFFDKWIGEDYELGLARLKAYLETMPATDFADLEVEIVEVEPMPILYVVSEVGSGGADITASLASAYQEVIAFMSEHGIDRLGQPMTITRIGDGGRYEVEAAIPVRWSGTGPTGTGASADPSARAADEPPTDVGPGAAGRVQFGHSPGGRAVRVVHLGSYERMGPSYEKLAAWMAAHGLGEGRISWEQYISDPGETPEDELVTHIFFRTDDDG